MALCMLACWDRLRYPKPTAVAGCCAYSAWLILCGAVSAHLRIPSDFATALNCILGVCILMAITNLSPWKVLWVAATAAYLGALGTYLAITVDAYAVGDTLSELYLAWPGMATQWVWDVAYVAVLWRIVRGPVRDYLGREDLGSLWYYAWLLPAGSAFAIALFRPEETANLLVGRVGYLMAALLLIMFALMVLVYVLVARVLTQATERIRASEELRHMTVAMQQYRHRQEQIDELRRIRHDLRYHMHVLSTLLSEGDVDSALAYLHDMSGADFNVQAERYCENRVVDALADYYLGVAARAGARVDARLDVPHGMDLPELDLAVAVGNVLENAASIVSQDIQEGRSTADDAFVRVRAQVYNGGAFVLTCDNSCARVPSMDGAGDFAFEAESGPELSSVRAAAARTDGEAKFSYEAGVFKSSVIMQCGLEKPE